LNTLEDTVFRLKQLKRLSYRTEKTYLSWITKEPGALAEGYLKHFLSYLAVERKVRASTRKQAFIALLFYCRDVLSVEITGVDSVVLSRILKRLPVVLTKEEIQQIFSYLPFNLARGPVQGGCGASAIKDTTLHTRFTTAAARG
jgi:hypothetical protein